MNGNEGVSPRTCDWLDHPAHVRTSSIDFLYTDPPFNTNQSQRSPPNGHKLRRTTTAAYADSFGTPAEFIAWLRPRIAASIPLIKPSGLIALHVDWRTSHHVRLLLDELVGAHCFVNHLIWSYGLGGSSPRRFARKHDDILLYCINPDLYYFHPPKVAATSNRLKGQLKKATDVLDIPSLNNMAAERTGYPTQKPLALLDLLIRACCPPGGLVFDPCCGSGTTLVAAIASGRQAVGGDLNPDAVALTRRRLAAVSASRKRSAALP